MKNSMLILGATGNIGSQLVQCLKNHQADFIAGVPATDMDKVRRMGLRGIELDFGDPQSLERAMQGVNELFMLLPFAEPMLGWARNILNAAQKSMIKFIVRSSLFDASPDSPYGLYNVHGQIDKLVRTCGIPYCIVHPNSFMQNFVVYYRSSILNNDAFFFPHDNGAVSFTDVRDIADVDCAVLLDPSAHQNREYNVTGPEALSDLQAAEIISQAAGRRIRYVDVSEQQYIDSLKSMGMSAWDIEMDVSLARHICDGKSATVSTDAQNLLGRQPRTFRQFALEYADQWKKAPVPV